MRPFSEVLENKKFNVCPRANNEQTLNSSLIDHYFLCDAQRFDFPDAKFLHALPSCVLAEHFTFAKQITSLPVNY